ncbi:Na+/H+ antiporter [Nocardioides sp. cx-173]|uniref:Na+/H+ antiporter n=1 Tax=Nocardioides sp. cx-173 TaxID=2898796 RepID=UPI001E3A9A75|nr:Na+/H+ antiporter [Nocardioides sp. cx-173]MCD4524101.1 Na+/H+ antiporter [Nocardioides sp. cx-173]UGB41498.1 Na+/H+ antiporter [Nocardioides sp. cx-173]
MEIAFFLVALAVTVLAVTALSERVDLPPPLALIAVGVAASYVPGMPEVHLGAEVVLLGLLPPLLYATAIQTSLVDFNANRRTILLLSVGLVVFTTAGIGAVVHSLIPGIGWPAAFAIGAVVAPPDAVAATAIARRIGLPRRIVTILEGESLLNDATALVALRTAIAAGGLGASHHEGITTWGVAADFAVAAGGGVAIGVGFFLVVAGLRKRITDPILDTAISLVVPFAAFVVSERVHASGVIAVVVAGLLLGHKAPIVQTAQSRIAESVNWRTIAFLLENAVFLLIGLQAEWLLRDVGRSDLSPERIVAVCAATLVGVIVLRMVWVFVTRYLLVRPGPDLVTGRVPPWSFTVVLGWAGMRGVVTLAAAFLIPPETEHREVLLLIAFTVVAGTLFVQGLSLPWLARWLEVPAPDPTDDALARATLLQQASKAGFEQLQQLEYDDPHHVVDLIRQRIDQRNFAAWERLGTTADQESPSDLYARIRLDMIEAERRRVLEIRSSGTVASDIVADVLALLDVEESMLDNATQERENIRATAGRRMGEQCEHLRSTSVVPTPADPECARCLEDGTRWVALRQCLTCGTVGCCDSSPGQHATEHFHETSHPVMQSAEPGEDWRWCYVHHLTA